MPDYTLPAIPHLVDIDNFTASLQPFPYYDSYNHLLQREDDNQTSLSEGPTATTFTPILHFHLFAARFAKRQHHALQPSSWRSWRAHSQASTTPFPSTFHGKLQRP